MTILGCAIVLGGGGTVNPQTEMILEVLTALLMLPLVASSKWQRGLGSVPRSAWLLAALVLLLPVLQLVPLPPSIWHKLPGRAVEIQSLALIGASETWMPLTMAPARTFASLLAMICPVLLMLQVSRLSVRGRNWLCVVIVAGGVVSLLLGVLQLSQTGGFDWSLYSEYSKGFLVGFQPNHNAEADFLIIVILAVGVLAVTKLSDGRHQTLTWLAVLFMLLSLVIGLLMTGSRTGISLSVPALIVLVAMLWPQLSKQWVALYWIGGVTGAVVLGSLLLLQLQSVQRVAARFWLTKEARWDLWTDTWFAMKQVWPFGSGIGTIVPMLEAVERLEVVDQTRPVRAHNDWLEWLLECGAPGLVVLGCVALVLAALIVRAFRARACSDTAPARRAQVLFCCGVLLILGLHAIMDYPTRSMSLAMLIAVAVGFVISPAATQHNRQ